MNVASRLKLSKSGFVGLWEYQFICDETLRLLSRLRCLFCIDSYPGLNRLSEKQAFKLPLGATYSLPREAERSVVITFLQPLKQRRTWMRRTQFQNKPSAKLCARLVFEEGRTVAMSLLEWRDSQAC
jgi:hypothetical protein